MTKVAKITLCLILLASAAAPLRAQPSPSQDSAQIAEEEAVRRQEATLQMRMKLADAQATEKRGRLAEAAKLYQEAVALFPKVQIGNAQVEADKRAALAGLCSVRLQLAHQAQARGDLAEAKDQIASALKLDPKNEGLLQAKLEIDKAAAARVGTVPSPDMIAKVPELKKEKIDVATMVQNGKFLYEAGKYDEAEVKLKEALKYDPNNRAAFYYLDLVKEARYSSRSKAREAEAKSMVGDVTKSWIPDHKGDTLPVPNPMAQTNLIYTSKGRQDIMTKLDRIRINEVNYDLPLGEVLKLLRDESKKRDPDGVGVNFMINPHGDAAVASTVDPTAMMFGGGAGGMGAMGGMRSQRGAMAGGVDQGALITTPAPVIDMNQVSIRVNPPLTNLRLADVLDVLTKVSDQPIKYTIEDYAVMFSPKTPEPVQLYSRTFKIDPNTFVQGLQNVTATILADIGTGSTGGSGGGGGGSRGNSGGGNNSQNGGSSVEVPMVEVAGGVSSGGMGGGGGQRGGMGGGQRGGMGGGAGGAGGGLLGGGNGGLPFVTSPNSTLDLHQMVRLYFTAAGVNLLDPGKSVFFNDRSGTLLVRASLQDLEIIEAAVQALNVAPPQLTIEAKFAEISQDDTRAMGFDWMLGNTTIGGGSVGFQPGTAPSFQGSPTGANPSGIFPGPGILNADGTYSASPGTIAPQASDNVLTSGLRQTAGSTSVPAVATITGILTDPQFRVVIRALEQRSGTDLLSAPKITTLSGRQAHISVQDQVTLVTGVTPDQTASGGSYNNGNNNANAGGGSVATSFEYDTQSVPFGPVLDVMPTVSADGFSIQLVLIPTITEFVGYDNPGQFVPQAQSVSSGNVGIPLTAVLPLPRMRVRQVVTSCNVWDGQTVVLGGLISENISKIADKVPILGDIPFIGRLFRSESSATSKKNLMIFVTPTLIDPAGNRMHTDEEMPFARNSVPPTSGAAPQAAQQ